MFDFLHKKKKEDQGEEQASSSINQNKFDTPPPPPPNLQNQKDFSQTSNPSFENNGNQFGFNDKENNQEANEEQDVSFEIPDFAEEDIDRNIKLDKEEKNGELQKPVYKSSVESEFNKEERDLSGNVLKDKIDIDLNEDKKVQEEESSSEENPFSVEPTNFLQDSSGEEELSSGESEEDLPEFNIDEDSLSEESIPENKEEDLSSIDFSVETSEDMYKENDDLKEFPVQEESAQESTIDESEELPTFNVNQEEQPKFVSKQKYKKMMVAILDAGEQTSGMVKTQLEFPKSENQINKHFQDIIKCMDDYKNKLIEIDKKIF